MPEGTNNFLYLKLQFLIIILIKMLAVLGVSLDSIDKNSVKAYILLVALSLYIINMFVSSFIIRRASILDIRQNVINMLIAMSVIFVVYTYLPIGYYQTSILSQYNIIDYSFLFYILFIYFCLKVLENFIHFCYFSYESLMKKELTGQKERNNNFQDQRNITNATLNQ